MYRYYAVAALVLVGLMLPVGAHADVLYQFNVSSSSGALHAFSFSFTSTTFLGDNDVPTFTPFTVTNGVDSWTLAQGLATQTSNACFGFGSAAGSSLGTCSAAEDGSPGAAVLFLELGGPLPTALGPYDLTVGFFLEGSSVVSDLTGTLDITSTTVPEPSSLLLLGTGLIGGVSAIRRRHSK